MNTPLRHVATVCLALFLALMASVTWVQYVKAPTLNSDGRNVRTLYREYGNFRGPIIIDGKEIAYSEPSDTVFGYKRIYTDGPLFAPVTGYYSAIVGRSGLERAANDTLNGTSDSLWWDRLQHLVTGKDPQGSSVELTISRKAQEAAVKALGNQSGAIVATDVKTGAILALVTSPSFDPNKLAVHSSSKVNTTYKELLADPAGPLVNRAIAGDTYPPGSVFKIITAAAALESGNFTSDSEFTGAETFRLPGTSTDLRNFGGVECSSSGKITLSDALRISCNTAFAQLGSELGADALSTQARKFGFDTPLAIPQTVTQSRYPDNQDPAQTSLAAIGQGSVTATPLQIAMISQAVANGGNLLSPYLIDTVRTPSLTVVSKAEPHSLGQAVSPATAATLKDMMIDVVQNGSGKAAQIPGVTVAGKTGTAESGGGRAPHAWFTAFAPADDPQVAIAVVVEHGGNAGSEATGGAVAAPMARAVLKAVLDK